MVDAIYNVQPVDPMGMETVTIDLTDESWYGYLAGLTADNVDKVDAQYSEPMTGSQANLVLLRLKDKADAPRSPIRWRKTSGASGLRGGR